MKAPSHEASARNTNGPAGESFWSRFVRVTSKATCQRSETIFDEKSSANRYALLDLLRFAACVMVLFWHYVHFFYAEPGVPVSGWASSQQPFYRQFPLFYQYGGLGVQVFWTLSGFVFFALFSLKIGNRELTAKRFAVDRFSRLYPLHVFSLLAVCFLVWLFRLRIGNDGIYPCNDMYHFILNLCFVPYVLPHQGWSFNAPVWSVSLELIAYVIFFVFARWCKPTVFKVGCMAAVFALLKPWPESFPSGKEINQCLFFFFSGGGIFLLLRTCSRHVHALAVYLLLVAAGGWLCASGMAAAVCTRLGLHWLSGWILFFVLLGSFPFSLPGPLTSVCVHLGNLTYAVYMLHVSMQLSMMFVMKVIMGKSAASIAVSPWFFLFYLATVLAVAEVVYRYFELPAKLRLCGLLSD